MSNALPQALSGYSGGKKLFDNANQWIELVLPKNCFGHVMFRDNGDGTASINGLVFVNQISNDSVTYAIPLPDRYSFGAFTNTSDPHFMNTLSRQPDGSLITSIGAIIKGRNSIYVYANNKTSTESYTINFLMQDEVDENNPFNPHFKNLKSIRVPIIKS